MPFQLLSGVSLNNGPWGSAFGGGIYAANCEIGFSRGPTKISINIVNEGGNFKQIAPNVVSSPYDINFNGHIFSGMHLYSYEKQKSAGQSTMTANFIDSSLVLDKIYVGLLNRQGRQFTDVHLINGSFTVRCPQESQGGATGISGIAYRAVDYITTNDGCYFKKGADGGGYIILGSEYFPLSQCEVPKVDYNFSELCSAMSYFGINHELNGFDLNPLYRQEYVGTLREVLNNWAADFAFEFFYENNTLKGINLQEPINVFDIESFALSNEYVNNVTCGESLENSSNKTLIGRFLKGRELVTFNNTYHYKVPAYPIGITDILASGTCAGRGGSFLLNSIALARLDPALRQGYIADRAAQVQDLKKQGVLMQCVGMIPTPQAYVNEGIPYPIYVTGSSKVGIIRYLSSHRKYIEQKSLASLFPHQDIVNNILLDPENYDVFFAFYSADLASKLEQWDKEASNFLGKYYYYNGALPSDSVYCPQILGIPGKDMGTAPITTTPTNSGKVVFPPISFSGASPLQWSFPTGYPYSSGMIIYDYNTWNYKWTSNPTSQNYGGDAVPFASLLIDPIRHTSFAASLYKNICLVSDNSWGIESSDYQAQKGAIDYSYLKPEIVLWKDFPNMEAISSQAFVSGGFRRSNAYRDVKNGSSAKAYTDTQAETQAEMAYFVIPDWSRMAAQARGSGTNIIPKISEVFNGALNRYVYNRAVDKATPSQVTCKTYCEYGSIESEICNLVGKGMPFIPYFANLYAPYSVINHPNGNTSQVIFPVNSTFYGNWTLNLEEKFTAPAQKQIYGEPPSSPSNTMTTQVIDFDMTSDMTAIRDNNDAINSFVYSPTLKKIMTSQDYYEALANLNNIIVPPQRTVKMTIANVNFNLLGLPLSPASGLTNMSLSISDGGMQANLEYASRPKTVPKAEAVFPKVKFRINGTPNSRGT